MLVALDNQKRDPSRRLWRLLEDQRYGTEQNGEAHCMFQRQLKDPCLTTHLHILEPLIYLRSQNNFTIKQTYLTPEKLLWYDNEIATGTFNY